MWAEVHEESPKVTVLSSPVTSGHLPSMPSILPKRANPWCRGWDLACHKYWFPELSDFSGTSDSSAGERGFGNLLYKDAASFSKEGSIIAHTWGLIIQNGEGKPFPSFLEICVITAARNLHPFPTLPWEGPEKRGRTDAAFLTPFSTLLCETQCVPGPRKVAQRSLAVPAK